MMRIIKKVAIYATIRRGGQYIDAGELNFSVRAIFNLFFIKIIKKNPHQLNDEDSKKGSDLLSHITAVPSTLAGLTSLFGMGRGEPRRNNHLKNLVASVQYSVGSNALV
jgi:hypothetical protein